VFGISIIRLDVAPIAWKEATLRYLLTNPRKRGPQDFMAGTVVVKTIYLDKIREAMKPSEIEE